MDPKLVATKTQPSEVSYIAKKFKIPVAAVRKAIADLRAAGKGYRSRASIYAKLREAGFPIPEKKKSLP